LRRLTRSVFGSRVVPLDDDEPGLAAVR
jgi:hypothetical protein